MAKKVPTVPKGTADPTTPAEVNAGQGEEAPPAEYLKVVVQMRLPHAMIGVSQPGKDPHLVSLEMAQVRTLEQVLAEVPGIVELARVRWETAPQYPRYTRPAPPQRPPAPARTTRVAPPTPSVERPRMF